MPFDAQAPAEVTARDRVIQLRDFLDRLPDERFNIRGAWSLDGASLYDSGPVERNECGTAACISGWAQILWPTEDRPLGLTTDQEYALFMPPGWSDLRAASGYTRARAVATLDRYLATGKISWDAP